MKQAKWFLLLHVILGIYAGSSVCSKLAAQQPFLSAAFIVLYGLMLLALGCVVYERLGRETPLQTGCNPLAGHQASAADDGLREQGRHCGVGHSAGSGRFW